MSTQLQSSSENQLSTYASHHKLNTLFSSLLHSLTVSKPDNPIDFLIEQLENEDHECFKVLVVGNYMHGDSHLVVKRLREALKQTSEEVTIRGYVTSAQSQHIHSRLDALKFQQKGLNPDFLICTNVEDYERYQQLTQDQISQEEFEAQLFEQKQLIEVFKGGSVVVDCTNEENLLTVVSCARHAVLHQRSNETRYAIIGKDGSGKTTHAQRLSQVHNVPRLEPNQVLAQFSHDDPKSEYAQVYMKAHESNESVPDDIINKAMLERISSSDCASGYILDGYPATKPQADFVVEQGLVPQKTIFLDVENDTAEKRLAGRQVHQSNGELYHEEFYPAPQKEQDALVKRDQDSDAKQVQNRLRNYTIDQESILAALDESVVHIDANINHVLHVQYAVLNASYGHSDKVEKILVIGAPLAEARSIAQLIAKERQLNFVHGKSYHAGSMRPLSLQLRQYNKRGFVLSECPKSVHEAKKLLELGIAPTHIIILHLSNGQVHKRASSTLKRYIKDMYFEYITNKEAMVKEFESIYPEPKKHITTINGAQLIQKVVKDSISSIEGIESPLRLIFAGAPASGKGTQCEQIRDKYNLIHLSTGDMLREAVRQKTELGLEAAKYMNQGQLVPDRLIEGIVALRLNMKDCQEQGWILDGFPRTESQAKFLVETNHIPDAVVLIDVSDEVVVSRISGRRTDPETGNVYHITFNPPPSEEIATRLQQRTDDTEEKVRVRLKAYHANISGLTGTFKEQVFRVNGNQKKQQVTEEIASYIDELKSL